MQKAYDIQILIEMAKKRGLNLTEDAAKGLVLDAMSWFSQSAALSATPIDDVFASLAPHFQAALMKELDKIDGEVDA